MLTKTQAEDLKYYEEMIAKLESSMPGKTCLYGNVMFSQCINLQKNLKNLKKRRQELLDIM